MTKTPRFIFYSFVFLAIIGAVFVLIKNDFKEEQGIVLKKQGSILEAKKNESPEEEGDDYLKAEKTEEEKSSSKEVEQVFESKEYLKDKIGQMLIVGFRGTEINNDSYIVRAINDLNLGGVIFFDRDVPSQGRIDRNIKNPLQVKKLTDDLRKVSPLFIAIDAEGGYVNRLKEEYGFRNIPSAQKMGEGSFDKTKKYGIFLGNELKSLGFNLNFAPVVDVNINPNNPIIGRLERSFSKDADDVFRHAAGFIEGMKQNKIIPAIKHFPGHGSSKEDSHLGMVDVTNTYSKEELLPYRELILSGYSDIIMTAHIVNKKIDPYYPATLSSFFLEDILRKELGFRGVIVSDDMDMAAISNNYGFEESIIKAINAGCDILIISNNMLVYDEQKPYRAVEIIFDAVQRGEISEDRINQSYNRIQALKKEYSI